LSNHTGAALAILVLVVASLSFLPHETRAYTSLCCEYAVYSTDVQPKFGERVDLTGVVTDRFGGGQGGVEIQYTDAGNYQNRRLNATSDVNGAWHLSAMMPNVSINYPMHFAIDMNDSAQGWTTTLSDEYSYVSPSGDVPGIYESQFTGHLNAYINIQSVGFPAVIFLSGGYDQPILTGDTQLDQNTLGVLNSLASAGFNVIAPIGWFVQNLPIFPYVLAALVKYGMGISQVYLLGWSAGGTVAAWTLVNDNYGLFNLAVIMDAELQGAAGSTQTDPTVFETAQLSSQAKVPHLLIWGMDDSGSITIQSAFVWARNAPGELVRLDPFPYTHVWIGTPVEPRILEDIIGFFKARFPGTFTSVQSGNITLQLLTNSQVIAANTTYTAASKSFTIQVTEPNGTIGSLNAAVPKASIDGPVVVLVDNITVNAPTFADANTYHVYLTYSEGRHVIVITGQNTVPEFMDHALFSFVMSLLMLVVLLSIMKPARLGLKRRSHQN
jgi:pimeloyl-ACP methyl ester carboxylesterase